MISNSKKFIFIHIPKTAGTSIETSLRPYQTMIGVHQHENLAETIKYKSKNERYFIFTVVRNPFDRMVSLYEHFSRRKYTSNMPFNKWLKIIFEYEWPKNKPFRERNFWRQYDWCLYNDTYIMDYIIRFENLQYGWNRICQEFSIDIKLPHKNKRNGKKNYRAYYNKNTRNIVEKKYRKDLNYFGYEY